MGSQRVRHDWATFTHSLILLLSGSKTKQKHSKIEKKVLYSCFLVVLVIKNPTANAEDTRDSGSIPGSGRYPGVGNGNPLQYSCLEDSMDKGAWRAIVYGVAKSRTRLSVWALLLNWDSRNYDLRKDQRKSGESSIHTSFQVEVFNPLDEAAEKLSCEFRRLGN